MRQALWFAGVPLAALAGGAAGAAPVFVMGLSVSMTVIGPLALLSGALFATLCAGWSANLAALGASSACTRSRLPEILVVSLLAGVVALGVGFAAAEVVNALNMGPSLRATLLVYLPGAAVFALATAAATWRLRAPVEGGLGGVLTLAAGGLWLALILGVGVWWYLAGPAPTALGAAGSIAAIVGSGLALAAPGALLAVWRSGLMRDAGLSLGAVGLLPAVISASIYLGCSLTYCGV